MFRRLRDFGARSVATRWYWIVLGWFAIAITLRLLSPSWNTVVKDGDFQFLPPESPSRVGQAALLAAFPDDFARSQMVAVFATTGTELSLADKCTTMDVARRLSFATAKINFDRLQQAGEKLDGKAPHVERLRHTMDSAVFFDERWFDSMRQLAGQESPVVNERLFQVYRLRRDLAKAVGDQELADSDQRTLSALTDSTGTEAESSPNKESGRELVHLDDQVLRSVEELWTWNDPVLSNKLGEDNPRAKLLALQIREEFMAVQNVAIIEWVQTIISDSRQLTKSATSVDASAANGSQPDELMIEITGPAAVGADLIRAAKESVSRSELLAVLAVILTLLLIYRSPLLVFLPLITIGLSLSISISVLSILANWATTNWVLGNTIEVYSTTRVFLVVLIFGIGTDLTLFLVVRCRETYFFTAESRWKKVVSSSWDNVLEAILGSGLTTTIGLSMMAFASFAKFRFSGISIAISLLITLAVCVTFPPAAMAGLGPIAFWPRRKLKSAGVSGAETVADQRPRTSIAERTWSYLAHTIMKRPGLVLGLSVGVLMIPSIIGWQSMDRVTYNLVGELSTNATSRQGQAIVEEYFPRTETSAITVSVTARQDFKDDRALALAIEEYRKALFVDGVRAVQALTDPLGEFPPDRTMSLLSQGAWRRRLLQNHPLTLRKFVAQNPKLAMRSARFEVVTDFDPFSDQAAEVLQRVTAQSLRISTNNKSVWVGSTAAFSGTTSGIVDLKRVTQTDQTRVQILVVLSVFGVLLALTKRFELSAYLMVTVLLSYLATLGVTYAVYRFAYGPSYEGLDWKVPLFLFVILVAVGQDYNIYLTTRIHEEQARLGWSEGLRTAIVSTGGIITSCGLIMFATFAAMCIGGISIQPLVPTKTPVSEWVVPTLRGISELGFALGFGVLLDTFVIRTVVVPAYIAVRKLA